MGAGPHRQRGASRLEWAVVVALIGILVWVAGTRLWPLRIAAERNGVEYRIGTLRSALAIEVIRRVKENFDRLPALDRMNPMDLLEPLPANYLGSREGIAPAAVDGYSWYFDSDKGMLIYRVANAAHFESELPGPARIRLQVQAHYEDVDGDDRFTPGVDRPGGVRLVVLDEYRWRTPS